MRIQVESGLNGGRAGAEGPLRTMGLRMLREPGDSGLSVMRASHDRIEAHDHLFHEIVYVETGTADHISVGGVRKLRPGDIIVMQPQIWHAYANGRRLGIINCLIENGLMRRLGPLLGRVGGAFELFRRRPRNPRGTEPTFLHASPLERGRIVERLESIMGEQRSRADGWQDAATVALLDILIGVARLQGRKHAAPAGIPGLLARTHQGVLDAASHIEAHFTQAVSLEGLAGRVHLSPGHLSRSFSRRMGMGVVQYMHRMRAEEACRLLRCTGESVSQIAVRVGYNEVAYFSRCFRDQMRQSPMEYRRNWQSGLGRTGVDVGD